MEENDRLPLRSFVVEQTNEISSDRSSATSESLVLDWTKRPYTSCIFYSGKPLLPPILTDADRREMAAHRTRAIEAEQRLAERRRRRFDALVADVRQRIERAEARNKENAAAVVVASKTKPLSPPTPRIIVSQYQKELTSPSPTSKRGVSSPSSYFSPKATTSKVSSARKRLDLTEKQTSSRLYAIARGYLTRALYRSKKVRDLAATVKDLIEFLHNASPSSRSFQDTLLIDQVKTQLFAARQEIHVIFFRLPPHRQMALIGQTRELAREQQARQQVRPIYSHPNVRDSTARKLSLATQKSMERRERRMQGGDSKSHASLTPTFQRSRASSAADVKRGSVSVSPKARRRTYVLSGPSKLLSNPGTARKVAVTKRR